MQEFNNVMELKVSLKSDNEAFWDNLDKFKDLFMYVFKDEIEKGQVQTLLTILRADGVDIARGTDS